MKKLAILFSLLILGIISFSQVNSNYHYVNGYSRSNGSYVKGHYRTNPNCTNRDNYSTYPNINPHTGKQGTIAPDNNTCISLPTFLPIPMNSEYGNRYSVISEDFERKRAEQDKKWGMNEKALSEFNNDRIKQEKEWSKLLKKVKEEAERSSPFDFNKYMSERTDKKLREEYGLKQTDSERNQVLLILHAPQIQ
jgi:hypothetical protein